MSNSRWALILACIFLIPAGATRFCRLGWSFSGDETSTFGEVQSLVDKPFFMAKLTLTDALPRAHPVAYMLQFLAHKAFGQGEFGARVGVATAGTLAIALIVLLTCLLFGKLPAIFTGIMLLLWPWQLGHSQVNRMYSYAFLFGSTAILSGALAWERKSFAWGGLSGIASALAISSHNFTVIIPASFGIFVILERLMGKGAAPRRGIEGYVALGIPLILLSSCLAWLAMRRYTSEVGLVYSAPHTLMALANNLSWSVTLLAVVGWSWAWRSGNAALRLFAVVAGVAVLTSAFLPAIVAFRHDYLFAISLPFLLLASQALVKCYEATAAVSRPLAWGIAAAFFLMPLPSFVSYYQDGGRKDYRGAAEYIKAHWQEGDLAAADANALLSYYLHRNVLPAPRPFAKPKECIDALEKIVATGKRAWYVCRYERDEPPTWTDQWLWQHAWRMLRIKKKRFDYEENALDVYLLNPNVRPIDSSSSSPLKRQETMGQDP